MKHYSVKSIEDAWKHACYHHVENCEFVMDSDISKGPACCLSIAQPWRRVPSASTNPLIPFWLSVLAMTEQDQDPAVIQQYVPEIADFRDQSNCFSLAMGARFREYAGFDQFNLVHETLRLGMQVVPVAIFDVEKDHALQHRPSALSVVISMFGGDVNVVVNIDAMLLHEVPFHSELSVISVWQEMLCAYLGKRIGSMDVVCGATAAMQSDSPAFRQIVDGDTSPELQNLPVMGNESDPEILMSDFRTWPMVGVAGKGYKSDFFRHTVLPMAMVTQALKKEKVDLHDRKQLACEAAQRIRDVGWRGHVTNWVNNHFVE